MPHLYDGYFINMDRSVDRRARFERQIERLGLGHIYQRFPAVDGSKLQPTKTLKARSVGAFHSQRNVLVAAKGKKPFVHVLEDDTVFSEKMAPTICHAIGSGIFDRYDLLFTDIAVQADLRFLRLLENSRRKLAPKGFANLAPEDMILYDLAELGFAGLPSFVIDARRIDFIVDRYDREIAQGPSIPIDLFIRREIYAKRLRAACVFPFLSSVGFDDLVVTSTGRGSDTVTDTRLILALIRYAYFIDADIERQAMPVLRELKARLAAPDDDAHHALMMEAIGLILSRGFVTL